MGTRDFDTFYRDYFPVVRQFAARRFGQEEAEDIAQETMLRAYRHFHELDSDRAPEPWLATIAHRVAIDFSRRHRPVTIDADMLNELAPSVPDRTADVAVRVDVGGTLRDAMRRLSLRDREVLTLHEMYGLAVSDIAARSGTTPNTIRQRLFRARTNLERQYRELGGTNYAPVPAGAPPSRRRRAVDAVVRTAHRMAARVCVQPTGRMTAAAAVIAVTVSFGGPPPGSPPERAQQPPAPAAPVTGRLPRRSVGTPAALALPLPVALPLGVGGGAGPVPLPYADGFDTGLSGWTVTGRTAGLDCLPGHAYRGLCALRLDPDGTVRLRRPFDTAVTSVVRLSFVTRGDHGTPAFELGLDSAAVSVTVDVPRRVLVLSVGDGVAERVALVGSDPWYSVSVLVDPVAGTVEARQDVGGQQLAPLSVTLPAPPRRIGSLAFAATGHPGDTAWLDDVQVRPDRPQCADGIDNDGDGRTDQEDPGCYSLYDDTESPDPQCGDGIDNDGDGLTDMADPSCTYPGAPSEQSSCSDGVDNDGDGLVDYPDDPDCHQLDGISELPRCANGFDDDGDGTTDYPADLGCTSPTDDDESACTTESTDSRPLAPGDVQRFAYPAGFCVDPVRRIAPVAVVTTAPAARVRAYVDSYRIAGYVVPCVVVPEAANACAALGGTFVEHLAALVRADSDQLAGAGPNAGAYLCAATVRAYVRHDEHLTNRDERGFALC